MQKDNSLKVRKGRIMVKILYGEDMTRSIELIVQKNNTTMSGESKVAVKRLGMTGRKVLTFIMLKINNAIADTRIFHLGF